MNVATYRTAVSHLTGMIGSTQHFAAQSTSLLHGITSVPGMRSIRSGQSNALHGRSQHLSRHSVVRLQRSFADVRLGSQPPRNETHVGQNASHRVGYTTGQTTQPEASRHECIAKSGLQHTTRHDNTTVTSRQRMHRKECATQYTKRQTTQR